MGGEHSVGSPVVKLLKEHRRQGTTQIGVGTGAEFVDQEQGAVVARAQELRHLLQPVGVGGQVIFDGLVVADVGEDVFEQTHRARRMHRHQQPALEHELEQADRLQGDALSSGIGPRDGDDALFGIQLDVLWKGGQTLGFVLQQQDGVVGFAQVDPPLFVEGGQAGPDLQGVVRFGLQEVHLGEQFLAGGEQFRIGADLVGEGAEDAQDFLLFFLLGGGHLAREAYGGFRFDENDAAGAGGPQGLSAHLPARGGRYGQHPAVVDHRFANLVQQAFGAAAGHFHLEKLVDRAADGPDAHPDAFQLAGEASSRTLPSGSMARATGAVTPSVR